MNAINEIDLQYFSDENDPLVSLRQHRREISDRFKTVGELTTYLRQFDSVDDALSRVRAKIVENKRKKLG